MDKQEQKKLLTEVMQADEKDGLYSDKKETTQTAVEWMAIRYHHRHGHLSLEDIEKAKEMMKKQIIKAFNDLNDDISAEQYYNETYEKS